MVGTRSTRRRVLVGAAVLLMLCVVLSLVALGAGASDVVTNPGNVSVSMSLSVLTFGQNELGIETLTPANGSIDREGALTIFGTGITFAPITLSVDVGDPAPATIVVDTVALGDFKGGVDPRSGRTVMRGAILQRWSWQGTPTTCPVGPILIDATTNGPGARSYSEVTGTATLVDDHVQIGAVAPNTPGCDGLESVVNDELQLPITTTTATTTATATTVPASRSSTATATSSTIASSTTTLGTPSPSPPPVPSIVLSLSISPPPSAHSRRSPTTTAPAQGSTPTTARRMTPPPPPVARRHTEAPHERSNSRERVLEARRMDAKRALALALALAKKNERVSSSSTTVAPPPSYALSQSDFPPMTWARPRKHRNALASLRALPASAMRSTSPGGWPVIPFLILVALAVGGVTLIKSEVKRSRPRHRLRFHSIEAPPEEERTDS